MRLCPAALILLFPALLSAQGDALRVHITDRDTWKQEGGFVLANGSGAGHERAGLVRQNTELVKTFNKTCPAVTITADKSAADFIVIWDHSDWAHTNWGGHQNEYSVYRPNGDLVGTGAAHKMPNAAKDICKLVMKGAH